MENLNLGGAGGFRPIDAFAILDEKVHRRRGDFEILRMRPKRIRCGRIRHCGRLRRRLMLRQLYPFFGVNFVQAVLSRKTEDDAAGIALDVVPARGLDLHIS